MRGCCRPNRTATYLPPLLWPSAFLSRSPVLLSRAPRLSGCWFSLPHLISNTSEHQLSGFLSSPGLCNNWTFTLLPASITISHSFNLPTVKVIISWYSTTGCTCYLHRCLSYFDSPAGSEANIQQEMENSEFEPFKNWPCVTSCSYVGRIDRLTSIKAWHGYIHI